MLHAGAVDEAMGRFDAVPADVRAALPKRAFEVQSMLWAAMGRFDLIVEMAEQTLKTVPMIPYALQILIVALKAIGRRQQAERVRLKAGEDFLTLALRHVGSNQPEEAAACLQMMMDFTPELRSPLENNYTLGKLFLWQWAAE